MSFKVVFLLITINVIFQPTLLIVFLTNIVRSIRL